MKNILLIVGTRPNFIKAAPVYHALTKLNSELFSTELLHTGQHYDSNMSDVFLDQLSLNKITYLETSIAGLSELGQIAQIITDLEKYLKNKQLSNNKVDLIVVFGDVTSTLVGALVANKMNIKLAHIESGNRSYDKRMPEEVNRILVDSIADYLFVAEPNGIENLKKESVTGEVYYVGNSMIDTLFKFKDVASDMDVYKSFGMSSKSYVLVTLHRPQNVDNVQNLHILMNCLTKLAQKYKILFPVHPRKRQAIFSILGTNTSNITLIDPQGYLQFLNLIINCSVVVTDSGGIQEETTSLNIPCVTIRPNTERPITCTHGTNTLITTLNSELIVNTIKDVVDNSTDYKNIKQIPLWDGNAGERIASQISKLL